MRMGRQNLPPDLQTALTIRGKKDVCSAHKMEKWHKGQRNSISAKEKNNGDMEKAYLSPLRTFLPEIRLMSQNDSNRACQKLGAYIVTFFLCQCRVYLTIPTDPRISDYCKDQESVLPMALVGTSFYGLVHKDAQTQVS